jgi:soluble lytic murein transglycosylase-like protein
VVRSTLPHAGYAVRNCGARLFDRLRRARTSRRHRLCLLAWLAVVLAAPDARGGAIGAGEAAAVSAQCGEAIRRAARATGVPVALLLALAPTESGLPRAHDHGPSYPWPWTLNTNGRGSFHFRTREAAEKHLNALVAAGIDNIDIGCMQINWHWHGTAFASPAAALSPAINAAYAAVLLQHYKRQSGSWAEAVGLYHSHTPALADAYRCRVARELRPGTALKNCAP